MRPPEPPGSARSAIPLPMPTPLAKPQNNKRMSLAGPALRNAMLPPSIPGSVQQGGSMYKSHNMNPLLMSTSKAGVGRTPAGNRRGSMWQGGATPAPAALTTRDTRPLRDRAYQLEMRKETAAWLNETGCPCTAQTLANITAKDFRTVFQHLVLLLDPNYPFDPNAKLEEDFIPALKAMVYPHINQLDVKWLVTPASMHAWPSLLGVLHWLVEMGKVKLNYMESHHPTLQDSKDVPEEFSDPHHHHALAMDFMIDAYDVFLAGSDSFESQKQALEARYGSRTKDEIMELKAEYKASKHKLKELKNSPASKAPIEKIKAENVALKRDEAKGNEVMKRWEERKIALVDSIAKLKAGNEAIRAELQKLREQEEDVNRVVKTQNLSVEEVVRMNTEYETLERNLGDLKNKISDARKSLSTLEITVANRTATTEDIMDKYNRELAGLGFLPTLPPPYEDMDISLRLNPAASNPQDLLRGLNIRGKIRPTLAAISQAKRVESGAVENERLQTDHEIDQVVATCEQLEIRILSLSKDISAREEQTNELRDEIQRVMLSSSDEITRLEGEIARASNQGNMHKLGASQHLQAVEIAFREQVDKLEKAKVELMREMLQSASEIVAFKEEVSQNLQYLLDTAEST
ncbi:hypothetical protein PENSPDRAFT_579344 [Peniophora sp. CONT]|nr:hypothetical protein PENSPDRAFT_579344 [Peniophora sp. CONT]